MTRITSNFLRHEKATQTPRNWSALYMQRPVPDTGDYFKAEWLKSYDTVPENLHVFGASDYAVTSSGGDYTVHVVVGLDPENKLYLLDLWRGRTSSEVWVDAMIDLVQRWKPITWAEETGQIRSGIGPFLERRMRERRAWVLREVFPTRGDKAVRAQSIRAKMALDGLYIPTQAAWRNALIAELLSFPAGKHDDAVDALGLCGQWLDRMTPAMRPQVKKRKTIDWSKERGVRIPGPPIPVSGFKIRI